MCGNGNGSIGSSEDDAVHAGFIQIAVGQTECLPAWKRRKFSNAVCALFGRTAFDLPAFRLLHELLEIFIFAFGLPAFVEPMKIDGNQNGDKNWNSDAECNSK